MHAIHTRHARHTHSRTLRLNIYKLLQGGFFGEAAFMTDRRHFCDFVASGHTWPIGRCPHTLACINTYTLTYVCVFEPTVFESTCAYLNSHARI